VSPTQRAIDAAQRVHDATDPFLVGGGPALADQLAEALFVVSAHVARLRRTTPDDSPVVEELGSIDDGLSVCIGLARRLSTAVRSHAEPGNYADAAGIARDLGRHLAEAMPEGTTLNIIRTSSPALVAMPSSELRRVLAVLVRRVVTARAPLSGELALEVIEDRARGRRQAPIVKVFVGHGALEPNQAAAAADDVRPLVNASGGSVEPCARRGGGAAIVVSLPSAC
jgi:hypothetical protein